jgi:hypothetical protein
MLRASKFPPEFDYCYRVLLKLDSHLFDHILVLSPRTTSDHRRSRLPPTEIQLSYIRLGQHFSLAAEQSYILSVFQTPPMRIADRLLRLSSRFNVRQPLRPARRPGR